MAAYDDQLLSLVLDDVEVTGKELGRGAYGVVYEVRVSGLVCAGKKLHEIIESEYLQKYFTEECLLHSQLRHPNIVQFFGIHYPQGSRVPMLIMEYLPLSLRYRLETTPHLLPDTKYSILFDVARGLKYLHSRRPPIIHCDLTTNNIFLTSSYKAKICDFGGSIKYYSHEQDLVIGPGNRLVMPPEAQHHNPRYDHKLDVFSYGCLILSVLTHQYPIIPSNRQMGSSKLVSEWDRRLEYTSLVPSDHPLLHFAKSCLENDPHNRPNVSDAIKCIQGITQETNLVNDSGDTSFQVHGTDFEEIDQHYLHMALKEGEVIKSRITKAIVQGPARAGKTSLKCMLLHQKYQTELSTSCIEKPHIAVGKFALDESGQYWTGIDEEEMTDKVIAELHAFAQKLNATGAEAVQNDHTSKKIPLDAANMPSVLPNSADSASNANSDSNIDFIDDSSQNTKELTMDEKEAVAIVRELFGIASKGIKANQLSVHREWLYFIDSGGQIQFQKLLQAFLPCASVLILVFSLADNFSLPSSNVMECESGKMHVSANSITVEELLKQLVTMVNSTAQEQKKIIQNDSTLKDVITPPDNLSIIAVGTHRDVYNYKKSRGEEVEDIDVKEMKLGKILRSLEMKVGGHQFRDEEDAGDDTIIHEVDGRKAKSEDFNDEVVQAIGKKLQDQAFEVQVPLKWYCLDILLHKVAKKSHGVLSVTTCQRLGVELGISSGQEVISALKFFHILNTVLYYPESSLNDLVFVLPQMSLVQIISELMAKICKVRNSCKILDKAAKMLPMEGKISVKRLKKESETCKNLSAIFPNFESKFLSLFKDLLIAAKIPSDDGVTDNDQYFIPALLPVIDPSNHTPFPTTPLLYYFEKGLPMGFFCAMIVHLLTSSSFRIVTRQDSFNYSNYVILSNRSVVGKFVFIEKLDWFEVHSESSDNQSTVMTAVDEAVKATVKVRKLPRETIPVKAFFCPCGDVKQLPHLALFESEYYTLICTENQETVADEIGKPRLSWFSKDTYCKPHLSDLCMVLKPVSPRYRHIGNLLGVPMDALGLNPLLNHDDNLSTTLQWWLNNGDNPNNNVRSVTWNNIIDVIENGLQNYKVAEEMREFLHKGTKRDVHKSLLQK